MAKPGENAREEMARLAALSRGAADLGSGPIAGPMEDRGRLQAERQLGMRCGGCDGRIGVGFQFTRIDVVMKRGKPSIDVLRLSACSGADGCDYASKAREGADVVEMVEFVWLHGDAPVGGELKLDDAVQTAEDSLRGRASDRASSNGDSG